MVINDFIPYAAQTIDEEDIAAVIAALRSPFLTTGPAVGEFEEKIRKVTGAKYALAVSNGTAALHLASIVLLKPGDLVLTTPNSFVATANSIIYAGARPVFTDILENGNIDLKQCEKLLENDRDKKIKAIYAVHFSGNPADQTMLKLIKEKYGVKILEDCAHSIGAESPIKAANDKNTDATEKSVKIKAASCAFSDCSILSFHPVKHITTGEGGAITTNSRDIFEKLNMLRSHGINRSIFKNRGMAFDSKGNQNPWYYEMQMLGFNYRITDFQCALGSSQISRLTQNVSHRRNIAKFYDERFMNSKFIKPLYLYNGDSSYHLYVVKIDFNEIKLSRAELMTALKKNNIGTQVHYIPINKQPYYSSSGYGKEKLQAAGNYYKKCLSIPMYSSLTLVQAEYAADNIIKLIENNVKNKKSIKTKK